MTIWLDHYMHKHTAQHSLEQRTCLLRPKLTVSQLQPMLCLRMTMALFAKSCF